MTRLVVDESWGPVQGTLMLAEDAGMVVIAEDADGPSSRGINEFAMQLTPKGAAWLLDNFPAVAAELQGTEDVVYAGIGLWLHEAAREVEVDPELRELPRDEPLDYDTIRAAWWRAWEVVNLLVNDARRSA